jgi:hypothetical protein
MGAVINWPTRPLSERGRFVTSGRSDMDVIADVGKLVQAAPREPHLHAHGRSRTAGHARSRAAVHRSVDMAKRHSRDGQEHVRRIFLPLLGQLGNVARITSARSFVML